jgi:ubiquinone/menaquinone biosynthesis C-methylase UbiE
LLDALEVAKATGVKVQYINADVLNIPNEEELRNFDIVLMEFGILHYFSNLNLIFSVVTRMLKPNGRFILTDFHPFAHKLLIDQGNGIALKKTGIISIPSFVKIISPTPLLYLKTNVLVCTRFC